MMEKLELSSGYSMPAIGLGTWQANDDAELEASLNAALEAGYRHIDTAAMYYNEHVIGKVLKEWLERGDVTREELFITTKLPLCGMRAADVPLFLKLSLDALQLDYVDLYLVHAPFGLLREPDEVKSDLSAPKIDMATDHVSIWGAMEAECAAGRARSIGVSNFNEHQLTRLLDNCSTAPANLQVELHVYLQQPALLRLCQEKNIVVTAYSPFGSPGSTWITAVTGKELPDLLGIPEVTAVAKQHGKSPAQVLLRFLLQMGVAVVPKSTNAKRIAENFEVFDFQLTDEEMESLKALDQGDAGRVVDLTFVAGIAIHPEYPFHLTK